MDQIHFMWPSQNASLLCVPFVLFLGGGIVGKSASARKLSIQRAWSTATFASSTALGFALACCADALIHLREVTHAPQIDTLFSSRFFTLSFRYDAISVLMLLLVTFLGWIITNYSFSYLSGDDAEGRFVGALMWTLGAVSLLVVTNNLILFLVAWVLTSLNLHGLLALYPDRQAALIAAHKKFLASRLGDLSLLGAVVIVGSRIGSFEIGEVVHRIGSSSSVPASIHAAALLLAVSAMIKCAQLPLHGWLIQVMEAPTPVSALLHAGVINLGGFMLIRMATVINTSPLAQDLLAVSGCLTAILSSLVMSTRISIKVHLAWSTCAQMGFMLMECGLGLYNLAFLHLLAHSLYKAHAFLTSGETVKLAALKKLSSTLAKGRLSTSIGSAFLGVSVASLGAWFAVPRHHPPSAFTFGITIVGFAIAGILAAVFSSRDFAITIILSSFAFVISALYFGYESLFRRFVLIAGPQSVPRHAPLTFVLVSFALLYTTQTIIRLNPYGRLSLALYHWFYAGLYVDDLFTRAIFWLLPAKPDMGAMRRRDREQNMFAKGVNQ